MNGLWIAGNWKMNHSPSDTEAFFSTLKTLPSVARAGMRLSIFPPAVSLSAAKASAPAGYDIGSQSVHWEAKGAFTGEVSAAMLADIGVKLALVGHSERRQLFGETDEMTGKKVVALLKQGFEVMLCIGETREEREWNRTWSVLERQLEAGIPKEVDKTEVARLAIAYEPIWAIGTGLTATPAQAEEVHEDIRNYLKHRFRSAGENIPLLYGGSVTPDNALALLSQPTINGALVGGASLKPESWNGILQAAAKAS